MSLIAYFDYIDKQTRTKILKTPSCKLIENKTFKDFKEGSIQIII